MWKRVLASLEFPLLRRELTQSAGRRRTWVLRGVVSLVLVSVMLSWYGGVLRRATVTGAGTLGFLGAGAELLAGLVVFDLWAMLLLLPALTCSAISAEREKQTLGLVLVSRMTPAGIVFEKFLARLIPMAWLLLLTGPLLGVTYSMGGFSQGAISAALIVLLLAALQISSVAMFWSSLLGSSQSAFWMTYVSLIVLAAGPPFFKAINVYGFNQHNFVLYRLINPMIESFSHDTYDYSQGNGTMENQMTVQYETVKYYEGAIDGRSPDQIVKGFGSETHYDRTLSPIARPGSQSTILGPGGLVSAAGGVLSDLERGDIVGAIQKAGTAANTFKNPQNILKVAKSEALGAVNDALKGTPNRNTLFDFPTNASTIIKNLPNTINGAYKGVIKQPPNVG